MKRHNSVMVYLDDEEMKMLEALAYRQGLTLSAAARQCIRYVLFEVASPQATPENDPATKYLLRMLRGETKKEGEK